ncbi:MAG TPA: VOC family protein [Planctomycetota bacterium]|nr:VOC family protein [Planctomycetota bacterium]
MALKRIAHICLGAKDLAATEKFYCGALGCTRAFDFIRGGKRVGFYLRAGEGTFIEVFLQDKLDPEAPAPIRHLCLEVEGIDAMISRVKAAGFQIGEKKLGADRSWQVWTADPAGVKIEFHEYTPESSQSTGRDCVLS